VRIRRAISTLLIFFLLHSLQQLPGNHLFKRGSASFLKDAFLLEEILK